MPKKFSKKDVSILIGNALDHFDISLYSFFAPLLGSIFFSQYDPLVQLILAYSVLTTSSVTRPLGTFIFGLIARWYTPETCLSYSLIGVALSTVLIGMIPSYQEIGWVAPLSLVIVRMLSGIFAAGESTIAKLYIMENKNREEALNSSYFYESSTMLGIIVASGVATAALMFFPDAWRVCFLIGGLPGFIGVYLRRYSTSYHKDLRQDRFDDHRHILILSWHHKVKILRIAIATSLSHVTYTIPFVFMNVFIPLITSITLESMMILNTTLLILDMILVPIIGHLLLRWDGIKIMTTSGIILGISIVPLFHGLPDASLTYVIFVRVWIVLWGIVFLCPFNYWAKKLFCETDQYFLVGMGNALGAATLGRLTVPFCLWLWQVSGMTLLPSVFIATIAFGAACAVYGEKTKAHLSVLESKNY